MAKGVPGMGRAELEEFVASAALLAAHLTRQCEESVAGQRAATDELARCADGVGRRVVDASAQLQQHARDAIRGALAAEIGTTTRTLHEAGGALRAMTERLREEQVAAASHMRLLAWQTMGWLALAAAALVAGSGYAAWHNVQRMQRAQVQAEVLDALAHVAFTSCDGHPCIRLEDGAPRWSGNDQYVLIHRGAATSGQPATR